MSVFGFGGRNFDANLGSKIDQMLAGKKSQQDKVEEFLKDDLGVDPRTIPLTFRAACSRVKQILDERDVQSATFVGNSTGLKQVEFAPTWDDDGTCTCGSQYGYWKTDGQTGPRSTVPHTDPIATEREWYCYDCDLESRHPVPEKLVVTAKEAKATWEEDYVRIFNAARTEFPTAFTFVATHDYREGHIDGITAPSVNPDLASYPTGTTLRVETQTIDENGESSTRSEYVRVGGLFSDTDFVILTTMQPIDNPSSWIAVEVL
jgi:hypothetical protein